MVGGNVVKFVVVMINVCIDARELGLVTVPTTPVGLQGETHLLASVVVGDDEE